MTREDAYYLKHLLMSGFRGDYEEELNGYLEAEEPISDIALKLAFLGSDTEKAIYELGCYCSEEPFDEDAACHKLRLFLKKAYHSHEMTKDEVVHTMYRFALQHEDIFSTDSDVWHSMYILHDYYDLAEMGVISSDSFDQGFLDFLNDGILVCDEKMTAGVWSRRIL